MPLFERSNLRTDVVAGVTVALVLIPQSMAYAQLAGMPAHYGLYAALLPPIIGVVFGSSPQLSTGPVALTSVLTAAVITPLALPGSAQFVSYAVALAFLSGALQALFGMMRLGMLVNLLSHPVLIGFVHAAVALIILSQLPALLGISPAQSDHPLAHAWQAVEDLEAAHSATLALSLGAIVLLAGFRRYLPRWPGVLIVAATLTAISAVLGFAESGGRIVGEIPRGLPDFALPRLHFSAWDTLVPAALVVALISFVEAMASAKVAAIRTGARWEENRELVGQGLAKIAAALSQTMPVSGSFSRSALNLQLGARSGISAFVSAFFVLLTLLFFTPALKYLPEPVLAAIIVLALVGLIDLRSVGNTWRAGRDDSFTMLITFVATLAFSPQIQNGVFAGILASLSLFIYRRMRPHVQVMEPGSRALREMLPAKGADALASRAAVLRFDASLFFVNASYFEAAVLRLVRLNPDLRFVLVSAHTINLLDATGVQMLHSLADGLRAKGVTLAFSAVHDSVRGVMKRTGIALAIGEENFFDTDSDALESFARRSENGVGVSR